MPVPSFVDDDKRQNKGVQFGHKLPTRREIEAKLGYPAGPGPGGLLPVPSFVADNKRIGKGYVNYATMLQCTLVDGLLSRVVFGTRLKSRREIELKLGYPAGPAPGGSLPVPSFVADAQRQSKGTKFGSRLKSRREIEAALGAF